MTKDGRKTSNSTVALMTVAVIYKFILVVIGLFLIIFCRKTLLEYLGTYYALCIVGLMLNVILVVLILAVMFYPVVIHKVGEFVIQILKRFGIGKNTDTMNVSWNHFMSGYQEAVQFLKQKTKVIFVLCVITLLQRSSAFFVTYLIYQGFYQTGRGMGLIMALQASVYIAVDMLPVPGAQGITEMMYSHVFASIFPAQLLIPSMVVCRGVVFYLPLFVSFSIILIKKIVQLSSEHKMSETV